MVTNLLINALEYVVDDRAMSQLIVRLLRPGGALPIEKHDMLYLGEKLSCIFGPAIKANPVARAALKKALFGDEPEPSQ